MVDLLAPATQASIHLRIQHLPMVVFKTTCKGWSLETFKLATNIKTKDLLIQLVSPERRLILRITAIGMF